MHPTKHLFIFGSTGDLVQRKIIPALHALPHFTIHTVALGRKNLTTQEYQTLVSRGASVTSPVVHIDYIKIDLDTPTVCEECSKYLSTTEQNYFYVALPPQQSERVIQYVGSLKRANYPITLLIEKPFGTSYANALHLQKIIRDERLTNDTLISDHYLFKKEIVALERRPFTKLKLVSLEHVGLEKRVGYYDAVGALRDMVQSHFLNIVFKLLAHPEKDIEHMHITTHERAQYGNGSTSGYARDLGKSSDTETFVRVILKTHNQEFEFVTGKKFATKLGYLAIDDTVIHFDTADNPYIRLFSDLFLGKREHFATIEQSIVAWQLIEKIQEKKTDLDFYEENRPVHSFHHNTIHST